MPWQGTAPISAGTTKVSAARKAVNEAATVLYHDTLHPCTTVSLCTTLPAGTEDLCHLSGKGTATIARDRYRHNFTRAPFFSLNAGFMKQQLAMFSIMLQQTGLLCYF